MAAKQGLTAQIHQYSEDTKRSLLSRAPAGIKSHSWLSNLNTTCTIKSAPPRTPEVMSMLGTKCGWLVKRNEQHVWQRRWCCVVPHTFLYYFEASPMEVRGPDNNNDGGGGGNGGEDHGNPIHVHEAWSGGGINVNVGINLFTNLDQEALNAAVKDGYEEGAAGGGGSSRMSLYQLPTIMGGGGALDGHGHHGLGPNGEDVVAWDPETSMAHGLLSPTGAGGGDGDGGKGTYQFAPSSNLQPVGIIDLECYSAVNRSKLNPTVLELAGDAVTNPDLRSFYFQSPSVEDAESWTRALLSDRHQSLKDETDAYRQVCESFPLQLANCSGMIDAAEAKAEEMEREAYSVRSASEEGRRRVVAAIRDLLERRCWDTESNSSSSSRHSKQRKESAAGRKKKKGHFFQEDGMAPGKDKASSVGSYSGSQVVDRGPFPVEKESKNKALLQSVLDSHYEKLETNRVAFLRELEATLSSPSAVATSNVVPPVQTLVDYASAIVGSIADLRSQLQKYETDLCTSVEQDQSQLEAMRGAVEGGNARLADADRKHREVADQLRSELDDSRRREEELTRQLEAQRMEFGMYQNATKGKLSELQQHKKILKREVIELRKKIDECGSENTTVAHEYEKIRGSYRVAKEKNATLERYIVGLEKQVGVQHNMMEMMSQGGASFVGKIVGPGVTQSDSKDGVSLCGMSMGSNYRRLNGALNTGAPPTPHAHALGGETRERTTSHASSLRPRPLLPPEARGRNNNNNAHDVSPLPTPRFPGGGLFQGNEGNRTKSVGPAGGDDHVVDGEDDRDPSTAYHRSDTTTEAGDSPGSAGDDVGDAAVPPLPSPNRTPGRKQSPVESDGSNSEDPIMTAQTRPGENNTMESIMTTWKRPGENDITMSPRTPDDERSNGSLRADASKTPIQSNSFAEEPSLANKVARDMFQNAEMKKIASVDTDGEDILNVNASDDDKMKVVSLNDSLRQRAAKDLPASNSPDDDDDDDGASRVSDITEDRTQRQIDDDLAERRKILLAYVNKANSGPSLSGASAQRKLETIECMLPGAAQEDAEVRGGGGAGRPGRLSVAQRARQDADRSNTHRSPSPTSRNGDAHGGDDDPIRGSGGSSRGGNDPIRGSGRSSRGGNGPIRSDDLMLDGGGSSSSSRRGNPFRGDSSVASNRQGSVQTSSSDVDTLPSRTETIGRSGSFFKSLGKAIEKAVDSSVLGAGLPADETYDEESESEVMSSVVSEGSTTLADRIALQRERQVAFLQNKGLIGDDGSSLRGGGAGGASVTSVSSPSPKAPTPRRTISIGRSRSRWLSRVSGAQDEV